MSYILDISTAVPEYSATKEELVNFYSNSLETSNKNAFKKKLTLISEKTKIQNRYSCIPDFNNKEQELFTDNNFRQPIEKRMALYKEKVMPLTVKAIDQLLQKTNIETTTITHVITVSCTGLFAPGLEFSVAEHFKLQHTEKIALNFLGCYAAIKALKIAHSIAQSQKDACILIVCVELCTLHFYPSEKDEDIVANLLFSDGAAAAIVCGNENSYCKDKFVLSIDAIGSSYIPNTLDLMAWDISSSAFRMFLSKKIAGTIKDSLESVVENFLNESRTKIDYWAIHPGGVKIIQSIKESLHLNESDVEDSLTILREYGNMSSPTILFVLNTLLTKLKDSEQIEPKKIFACAFGPGLSIEMIRLTGANTTLREKKKNKQLDDYIVTKLFN